MLGRIVGTAAGVVMGTEPLRIFTELGQHPRLFRSWLPFSSMLLYRGLLPRQDTELAILRTAWNCRCRYEWVQHARLAQRADLDVEAIAATAEGPMAAEWSDHQRVIVEAVDELHRDRCVTQDTHRRLRVFLDDRQVMELCALVGAYTMLAMVLRTRGVQPEPQAVTALGGRLGELGDQLA